MPRYAYFCEECNKAFNVRHSMSEKFSDCKDVDCQENKNDVLIKDLGAACIMKINKQNIVKKTGELVKSYIQETADEIKQEKEKLKQIVYDSNFGE